MKIIQEHIIFEKFKADSDPISDLDIGIKNFWKKEFERIGKIKIGILCNEYFNNEDYCNYFVSMLYDTLMYIVRDNEEFQEAFDHAWTAKYYFYYIKDLNEKKEIILNGRKKVAKVLKQYFKIDVNPDNNEKIEKFVFKNEISEKFVFKSIHEKFEEHTDSVHDLGIGGIRLETLIDKKITELEKRKKELETQFEDEINDLLKNLLVGKTVTGIMARLPVYNNKLNQQISEYKKGKFTVTVNSIVDYEIKAYTVSVLIVGEDQKMYSIALDEKIYIK